MNFLNQHPNHNEEGIALVLPLKIENMWHSDMRSLFFVFGLIFLNMCSCFALQPSSQGSVKVIFTAALIDNQFEMRKHEYLFSLNQLIEFGASPFIVEACTQSSFFDALQFPIFYPNVNNPSLKNKGVNEARLLQEALKHFEFDDNELLVKLTGRYFFSTKHFLQFVSESSDADFIVRRGNALNNTTIFTGCYVAKYKYFKQFLAGLDLEKMEKEMINIEDELGQFLLRNPQLAILFVDSLDLTANIFGTGQCQMTHW